MYSMDFLVFHLGFNCKLMCEPHLEYRLIWIETCNQHLIKNSMTYLTLKGHMVLYYQLLLVAFCLMTSVLFLRNVIFTTLDSHAKWFLLTCVHLHVTISNSNHQYGLFISTVFMEYFLGFLFVSHSFPSHCLKISNTESFLLRFAIATN